MANHLQIYRNATALPELFFDSVENRRCKSLSVDQTG